MDNGDLLVVGLHVHKLVVVACWLGNESVIILHPSISGGLDCVGICVHQQSCNIDACLPGKKTIVAKCLSMRHIILRGLGQRIPTIVYACSMYIYLYIYLYRHIWIYGTVSDGQWRWFICHALNHGAGIYVTGFGKTNPNYTFGILRITNLKYLTHCESLLLGCSHAKFTV